MIQFLRCYLRRSRACARSRLSAQAVATRPAAEIQLRAGPRTRRDRSWHDRGKPEAVACYPAPPSRGAVAQFGRAPESHSGGRRFDPGQLHQQEFPLDSATILRIAGRLLDRTGDLRGLGGRSPPPDQHRAGRRRRRRPVRSRSAPPSTSLELARDLLTHRQATRPVAASIACLDPRCALAPAARASSLDHLGRLLAPRPGRRR